MLDVVLEIALGHPAHARLQIADRVADPAIKEPQQPGHEQDADECTDNDEGHGNLVIVVARSGESGRQFRR